MHLCYDEDIKNRPLDGQEVQSMYKGMNLMNKHLNLQLFAEGGAAGADGADAGPNGGAEAQPSQGTGVANRQEQQRATFDELLKDPEYKKAYDTRVQRAVQSRFRQNQTEEKRTKAVNQMMGILASRYQMQPGADGSYDAEALAKAVQDDNSWYEKVASERGIPLETAKELVNLKQANEQNLREKQVQRVNAQKQQKLAEVQSQGEALREKFPAFNLEEELQDPDFVRDVFERGIPVEKAYKLKHMEEILSGGMQHAVQRTAEAASRTVQAGANRPAENGAGSTVAAQTQLDPRKLTKEQRKDLRERINRGERVVF